jgi:hypothetical protein
MIIRECSLCGCFSGTWAWYAIRSRLNPRVPAAFKLLEPGHDIFSPRIVVCDSCKKDIEEGKEVTFWYNNVLYKLIGDKV